MKRKFKVLTVLSILTVLGLSQIGSIKAAEIGYWDETDGYSITENLNNSKVRSKPKHTGKSETKGFGGTDHKRAIGKTVWTGVYHYTRARMVEKILVFETSTLTDSGRKWGTGTTQAISPWWAFTPDVYAQARTNYGN